MADLDARPSAELEHITGQVVELRATIERQDARIERQQAEIAELRGDRASRPSRENRSRRAQRADRTSSRRALLQWGGAAAAAAAVTLVAGQHAARAAGTTADEFIVEDYGAVGDGTTDDTAAITNAIAAAGTHGGIVKFGPKTYKITGTLTLGNGSTSGPSTQNGINLRGVGVFATTLLWGGSAGGQMAKIAGISQGNSLADMMLDGASLAAGGIEVTSGQYAHWPSIGVKGTTSYCLKLDCLPSGGGTRNSLGNAFGKLYLVPAAGSASAQNHGLWLDGAPGTPGADSNNNTFENLHVVAQHNYTTALRLGFCDFNTFDMVNIFPSSDPSMITVLIDGTVASGFPGSNVFQLANFAKNPVTQGTPGINFVEHYDTNDGATALPGPTSGLAGLASNPLGGPITVPFGAGAVVNNQANALNTLLTTTAQTNVAVAGLAQDGTYLATLYVRVTGASNVAVTAAAYTGDETGTQFAFFQAMKNGGSSIINLNGVSLAPGSYNCIPIPLRFVGGAVEKPIIGVIAGTANVVYATASLIKIG